MIGYETRRHGEAGQNEETVAVWLIVTKGHCS